MKKIFLVTIVFMTSYHLLAQFENLTFGTDSTLDVVSWNIEHFPKSGQTTIDLVTQIVEALDADIIAIQEVSAETWLDQLVENLDGWDGYYAYDQYVGLAYIYKTEVIIDPEIFEIYTEKGRELPRSPLVMEMNYAGEQYVIINNHLKCCGDGYMNIDDPWDEETRRFDACNLIDEYIMDSHPESKVILLGDLNDILTDSPANNVFQVFIDNPDSYSFVDMGIAEGSNSDWSYPTWPSHIDHILITDELFEEYENSGSAVECIRLDDYFNGWYAYDNDVSDHRPVGVKINTNASLSVAEVALNDSFVNYPNPFINRTTFSFAPTSNKTEIVIYNMQQQLIEQFHIDNYQSSIEWNTVGLEEGVYYAKFIVNGEVMSVIKLIAIE
ncbi:MAG: endonuclease/exonuclease/phosphatase family protein [Bacteroidota bacterium]